MDKKFKERERKRKADRARKLNNPEKHQMQARQKQFKVKYNITLNDYIILYEKQGGLCLICRKSFSVDGKANERLHIDHCHKNKKVRGLLCFRCNTLIGHVEKNQNKLKDIFNYLNLDYNHLK